MSTLEESRSLLWQSVEGLDDYTLFKKFPNGWTIIEVLEHVWRVEKFVATRTREVLQSPPGEEIAMLPWPSEDRTRKLNAPPFTWPTGEIQTIAEAREALDAVATELAELIQTIAPINAMRYGFPHPTLSTMISVQQWYELVPRHELRHLAQIEEIKSSAMS